MQRIRSWIYSNKRSCCRRRGRSWLVSPVKEDKSSISLCIERSTVVKLIKVESSIFVWKIQIRGAACWDRSSWLVGTIWEDDRLQQQDYFPDDFNEELAIRGTKSVDFLYEQEDSEHYWVNNKKWLPWLAQWWTRQVHENWWRHWNYFPRIDMLGLQQRSLNFLWPPHNQGGRFRIEFDWRQPSNHPWSRLESSKWQSSRWQSL